MQPREIARDQLDELLVGLLQPHQRAQVPRVLRSRARGKEDGGLVAVVVEVVRESAAAAEGQVVGCDAAPRDAAIDDLPGIGEMQGDF